MAKGKKAKKRKEFSGLFDELMCLVLEEAMDGIKDAKQFLGTIVRTHKVTPKPDVAPHVHGWTYAVYESQTLPNVPVRHCRGCRESEVIEEGHFYALFGKTPAEIKAQMKNLRVE